MKAALAQSETTALELLEAPENRKGSTNRSIGILILALID